MSEVRWKRILGRLQAGVVAYSSWGIENMILIEQSCIKKRTEISFPHSEKFTTPHDMKNKTSNISRNHKEAAIVFSCLSLWS